MKKLLLALTAVAAFAGSASAADMAPQYAKAPPPIMAAPNWTGFYIFGGAGGGLWAADQQILSNPGGLPLTINQRQGGSGWFGTVGAGYDWQVNSGWVAGIFADGQFGSLKGSVQDPLGAGGGFTGSVKMEDAWAAGVRVGYLVAPNVLSYVNGGYSASHWSGSNLYGTVSGVSVGDHTNSFNRDGWFIGGGVENNLNIFGITAPGWFMKTEYRSAFYNAKTVNELVDGTNLSVGRDIRFNTWNQTISTSLVYRFNWTGPVVRNY